MQNFNPWVCLYGDFTTYKVEFTYFLLLYCKPCTLNRDKALILIFFFLVQESKKQMSVSTTISKVRCSYCKSEWLDQWEFYWFGWLVCSIIVGLEKTLNLPLQNPPFLFALVLIHTLCIHWLSWPTQINFNNNMVDFSLVILKGQLHIFKRQNCNFLLSLRPC